MIESTRRHWRSRQLLLLSGLFLLALVPRLYSAQTLGWGWDHPGSFTLVNFDEAGSCRAALGGFEYSGFIGRHTIAIAQIIGEGPPPEIIGNPRAVKAYCHSPGHILLARSLSAIAGAGTVVLLVLLGLQLVPGQPAVAWTGGALLALSGYHISYSQSATVDAASTFFIHALLLLMVYSVQSGWRRGLWLSPVALVPALWTKYWVFAVFTYLSLLPKGLWDYVSAGFSATRIALVVLATAALFGLISNADFPGGNWYGLLLLYYLLVPWRNIRRPMIPFWLLVPVLAWLLVRIDLVANWTTSGMTTNFGTGYAAIGWNKWLRNLVNLPAVIIVGLGIPAALFIPVGVRRLLADRDSARAWLCLLPVGLFALYMAFLAPVTYYRHYLPLLPAAALLAAMGLWSVTWARRPWFLALFFIWPALLAVDLVSDYHRDPRIELRDWFRDRPQARVFSSYYVAPPAPPVGNTRLFRPEYAFGDAGTLLQAQYLILSENWYDTAFANELNGPQVGNLDRLIKTKPEYTRFYRQVLAGEHPHLELERSLELQHFMPELLLHRQLYGNFQLFVGDLKIFRVVD